MKKPFVLAVVLVLVAAISLAPAEAALSESVVPVVW